MAREWEKLPLGDVITLQRGFDLPSQDRKPGKVPIVSSSGVCDYHSEVGVKGPGVVTGRYGTIGQVFLIKGDYWPLNTTLWVKDFHGNDPHFASYLLRTIDFRSCSDKSSVPGVNRNDLHRIPVLLPSLTEQKAIAEILGALDDKIELNRRINATLEAMARALFQSWFINFDPVRAKLDGREPVGMDASTASLFPAKFQDSPIGNIPLGWTVGTIEEATSLIIDYRGKTPRKLGAEWSAAGVPAVSAKNVKGGKLVRPDTFNFVSEDLYEKWMKDKLSLGDILMTSEAPLGELFYLALEARYCLSQRIFAMRANPARCESIILYYWLESPACQADINNRGTGTTVEGIRQSELRKVSVLLAPLPIQKAAAKFLVEWTAHIHRNEKQSRTLASLRDTLLPKLLSGELRVPDAEAIAGKAT